MAEVRLNVNIDADLHRRAKAIAALHGHTLSEIVRDAIAEYIEEMEDSTLLNEIEAEVAMGKQRTYSHEEAWAEVDELSA